MHAIVRECWACREASRNPFHEIVPNAASVVYAESEDPVLRNLERNGNFEVREGNPSVVVVEARRGQRKISPSPRLAEMLEMEFLRYVAPRH